MKYFIKFFILISFMNLYSYAEEKCIKNSMGIFCGVEVNVEEKNKSHFSQQNKRQCVNFKDKKICGYDCKSTIFGADCKNNIDETCIDNIHGVICGYDCKKNILISACASKPYFNCVYRAGEAKCGTNCEFKFGKITCDETDYLAKYLK